MARARSGVGSNASPRGAAVDNLKARAADLGRQVAEAGMSTDGRRVLASIAAFELDRDGVVGFKRRLRDLVDAAAGLSREDRDEVMVSLTEHLFQTHDEAAA